MKKIIVSLFLVLAVIVCQTGVFASSDVSVQSVQVAENTSDTNVLQSYTLTLDQAIEMAKKSSPVLECCDINKENIRVQLKSARISMKECKDTPVYASTNFDLVFVKQGYYVHMFEKQYELADFEKLKCESTIAYDVTQKYYNCKNAYAMYNSAQTALKRATENEEIVKKRYSLGMCTQLDVDGVTLAVNQCDANLEKCKNNIEIAEDALKIALGIDNKSKLNLTDDISYTNFSGNLEEDIAKSFDLRYDIRALKISAELADEYFKIVSSLDDENTTYYSAYTNHIKTEYDYSTGVKNIALAIKNSYYSALDAIRQAELAGKKLELIRNEYETYKIKSEVGLITNLALVSKADEITECENAYNNALLAQKLAIEKYYYDTTTGL